MEDKEGQNTWDTRFLADPQWSPGCFPAVRRSRPSSPARRRLGAVRGAESAHYSARALTAADPPAGFLCRSEHSRGAAHSRLQQRWRRSAARSFAGWLPRGIYHRLAESRDPRDTLPTRLSAQYLINRLLSFRLRLIESFRDGNPSVRITSGPNWVRNDAIIGISSSCHPIRSGLSSSVCISDAPSPLSSDRGSMTPELTHQSKVTHSSDLGNFFVPWEDKLHF